jgi:hypothetical protein
MRKHTFLILTAIAIYSNSFAQRVVGVETASVTTFYSSIDSAYSHAVDGSTIYIPGGAFSVGDLTISKRLNIIGVGHYADSSTATGITQLNGNVVFITGGDRSNLQGVYLNGDIRLGNNSSDQLVNSITIQRCNVGAINLSYNGSSSTNSQYHLIRENVIRGALSGGNAQNVSVENNLFNSTINYFNGNALFSNNIFFYTYPYGGLLNYVVSGTFESNIFLSQVIFGSGSTSNVLTKNIFTAGDQLGSGNVGTSNQFSITQSTLFVNQAGNTFNYAHNYHLANSSPAIGTGVNGNDIGIYGGVNTYKEAAVPSNPHIVEKNISGNTDATGKININIKVSAQTR